jgi:hypothetical protein
MDNQTINNVILHLSKKPFYEEFSWLQLYGNNNAKVNGLAVIINEMKRLDLIDTDIKNGNERYLLKLKARNAIKHLPNEYENKPYEYFFDEDKKEADADKMDKWYNRADAKKRFDEHPQEKRQKQIFMWAAIVELVLLLLSLLLRK